MRRTYLAIGALALVGLLAIAGCGSGGSSSSSSTTGTAGGEAENASKTSETGGGGGGYGGGGYGGGESSESSSAKTEEGGSETMAGEGGTAAGGAAVVKVTSTPKLGQVIVDSAGMTLYDFHKDKGTTSSCYGACAGTWPPLLTKGAPQAMGGTESSLLGTTKRKDGTVQVTYNGHPLYGYAGDQKPGETNGNDVNSFGAQWYALQPNGEESGG